MIHVTADTHNDINFQKVFDHRRGHPELTRNDYLIVAGDFGIPWGGSNKKTDEYLLKWISDHCNFTILFVDGNHENMDLLNAYPIVEKFGSKVHQLLPNLFHLMRGHIYQIDDYSIFAFGGAESTDKHRRIEGQSWWRQELPSKVEEDLGLINLERYGNRVDIVLTHDSPFKMPGSYHQEDNSIRKYFFHLNNIISYKLWIFGHHHVDRDYYNEDSGARASCLYNRVISLEHLLKK